MRGESLVLAGLGAQVVGVSTQGVWHVLLADRHTGLLTEDRTFLIDHAISNLGVIGMAIGSGLLCRERSSLAVRAVISGTTLEVFGAVADLLSHLRGGESRIAFALIGAGFAAAVAGAVARMRQRPRGRLSLGYCGS